MRLIVRRQLGTAPPSGRTLKLPGHEFPVFIPHNPIDLSLRFDDSQLEYGARWYDDFAKAATNLRERPEPYPDVVYYLKTGRLRRPDEPAWPEHTRRREQSRCPEVHTFDSKGKQY